MSHVTDTHALVWHLTDDSRLSPAARQVFRDADESLQPVVIPCISLFEILHLVEKGRIPVDFDGFLRLLSSSENYRIEPLCRPIIERSRKIPRTQVADPWDRLIAATALHLRLPLVTRDERLRRIGLPTLW